MNIAFVLLHLYPDLAYLYPLQLPGISGESLGSRPGVYRDVRLDGVVAHRSTPP